MDLLFHILIPYLVLRLFGINHKFLLPLAFVAVLPDFGRFIGYYKESHSLVLVAAVTIVFYIITRRETWGKQLAAICAFYLLSHLLLDLGSTMGLFWPIDPTFYTPMIALKLVEGLPVLEIGLTTAAAVVRPSIEYVLTPAAFGFFAAIAILFVVVKVRKRLSRIKIIM